MKKLDLNAYGVEAMSKQEASLTSGGIIPLLILLAEVALTYIATDAAFNPNATASTWQQGCDKAPTFDSIRNPF